MLRTVLTHQLTWAKPGGRAPARILPQAFKITLFYHCHNFTEELLAELFALL